MVWPSSSRFFLQSLSVCVSFVLFLLSTVPPFLQGFSTAIDWAGGLALHEPAGSECRDFPQHASQLIKEAMAPGTSRTPAYDILLMGGEPAGPWRSLSHPPIPIISIPKCKTSLVFAT